MKTFLFPSVLESHNHELNNVAQDLLHGMKIYHDGTGYIVGDLALTEGVAPNKAINSSPKDLDYQILLKSGLLLASVAVDNRPIVLTSGFPFSTYHINRQLIEEVVQEVQDITFDAATFGGRGRETRTVRLKEIEVVPEIVGCINGARKGGRGQEGSFFMCSLGYGTFEACLSTPSGLVQRTLVSVNGIRYAVEMAMKELNMDHYLGLQTEHQFDAAFQAGRSMLNRQRIDLHDVRKQALERYYEDVISPVLRNAWTDNDFGRSSTLLLAGGGAEYEDLVNCFRNEFEDLLTVEVVDNPVMLASVGYGYRSKDLLGLRNGVAIGLDIGNAHTTLSIMQEQEAREERAQAERSQAKASRAAENRNQNDNDQREGDEDAHSGASFGSMSDTISG